MDKRSKPDLRLYTSAGYSEASAQEYPQPGVPMALVDEVFDLFSQEKAIGMNVAIEAQGKSVKVRPQDESTTHEQIFKILVNLCDSDNGVRSGSIRRVHDSWIVSR